MVGRYILAILESVYVGFANVSANISSLRRFN
jgi:hypothetical protein